MIKGKSLLVSSAISLILNLFLAVVGFYTVILVLRVRSLYQDLGFSRTVMTPMLIVGALLALSGLTELLEDFLGGYGLAVHSLIMLLTALSFAFVIRSYHKMLMRTKRK